MKNYIVVLILVALGVPTVPGASKSELIKELMRVQGLHEMIEQARVANEAQVRQVTQNMIQELRTRFSNVPEQFMKELLGAAERFSKSASGGWTAIEAIEQWERVYGSEMSSEDIEKVLAYYKSPVGQRDVAASKAAMPKWIGFFAERGTAAMDQAMKAYAAEVQQIVARANAPRP